MAAVALVAAATGCDLYREQEASAEARDVDVASKRVASPDQAVDSGPLVDIDLPQIIERGRLVAITPFSPTGYFIYKGRPMGFEYDLISAFAEDLGLELVIVVAHDLDSMFEMLNSGKGDIVCRGLPVTKSHAREVEFTEHLGFARQVLVQRKPEAWERMRRDRIDAALVRNQVDLIGRTVHVRRASPFHDRLLSLSDEIGGDILIEEAPGGVAMEGLIRQVAEGAIDYTVADETIALVNRSYYGNIDVETPVSFPQRLAWAVRRNSPELLEAANNWIEEARKSALITLVQRKYFNNPRAFRERAESDFFIDYEGGSISEYDDILRRHAAELGWDWRLIAAQAYQESRFDPDAESWAGATGLMQLMPQTGELFGATDLRDPEHSVAAGVAYLAWLEDQWQDIPEEQERLKFVLGSYNAGKGHVDDARRLAEKNGRDPDVWDGHVADYMMALSNEVYYTDEVVRHGYCRGEEPVRYVRRVLDIYEQYRNFVDAGDDGAAVLTSRAD